MFHVESAPVIHMCQIQTLFNKFQFIFSTGHKLPNLEMTRVLFNFFFQVLVDRVVITTLEFII
jgi:hypothetical protein